MFESDLIIVHIVIPSLYIYIYIYSSLGLHDFPYVIYFIQGILHDCNKMAADYLFQQDKHYDVSYDTGDKVIQCGRHNDIFKFWLMWRAKVSIL